MNVESTFSVSLFDHVASFFFFLALSLLTSLFALRSGFFSFDSKDKTSFQNDIRPCIGGFRVFTVFGLFLFIQMIVVPLLLLLILSIMNGKMTALKGIETSPTVQGWFNLISIFGGGSGVALAFALIDPEERKSIWGDTLFSSKDFLTGVLTWFVSFPIVSTLSEFIAIIFLVGFNYTSVDQVVVSHLKDISSDKLLFTLTLLTIFTVVPMIEEVLFRGFLQSWLRSKMNRKSAIALTSLIFSLFHFSSTQGITNVELICALFVLSCFLGFLYEKQRSIWAPVGLHVFFNGISAMVIFKTV